MRVKSAIRQRYSVSATLSKEEKQRFDQIANEWSIKPQFILRRLIRYFIDGKITLIDILEKCKSGSVNLTKKNVTSEKYSIRTVLSEEEGRKLEKMTAEWSFLPCEISKRLVKLFILGAIEKKEIW